MRILLATPSPTGPHGGNQVTASRWRDLLSDLGHSVETADSWDGQPCDLLLALHAGHSAASVERFRARHPDLPVVVALTGTDVYGAIQEDPAARAAIEKATRLVALQPLALRELPEALRPRARTIFQSAPRPDERHAPRTDVFEVCVLAHLRRVKDPLAAARAARLLPERSRLRVLHAGAALDEDLARAAADEAATNPRYEWLGELPRKEALRLLWGSRLLVLTSCHEGGANVLSEALAAGVPVLASAIPGCAGILGEDYPGLFPASDDAALAKLLLRAEEDEAFYAGLAARCADLAPLVDPARERQAWADLLAELAPGARKGR